MFLRDKILNYSNDFNEILYLYILWFNLVVSILFNPIEETLGYSF